MPKTKENQCISSRHELSVEEENLKSLMSRKDKLIIELSEARDLIPGVLSKPNPIERAAVSLVKRMATRHADFSTLHEVAHLSEGVHADKVIQMIKSNLPPGGQTPIDYLQFQLKDSGNKAAFKEIFGLNESIDSSTTKIDSLKKSIDAAKSKVQSSTDPKAKVAGLDRENRDLIESHVELGGCFPCDGVEDDTLTALVTGSSLRPKNLLETLASLEGSGDEKCKRMGRAVKSSVEEDAPEMLQQDSIDSGDIAEHTKKLALVLAGAGGAAALAAVLTPPVVAAAVSAAALLAPALAGAQGSVPERAHSSVISPVKQSLAQELDHDSKKSDPLQAELSFASFEPSLAEEKFNPLTVDLSQQNFLGGSFKIQSMEEVVLDSLQSSASGFRLGVSSQLQAEEKINPLTADLSQQDFLAGSFKMQSMEEVVLDSLQSSAPNFSLDTSSQLSAPKATDASELQAALTKLDGLRKESRSIIGSMTFASRSYSMNEQLLANYRANVGAVRMTELRLETFKKKKASLSKKEAITGLKQATHNFAESRASLPDPVSPFGHSFSTPGTTSSFGHASLFSPIPQGARESVAPRSQIGDLMPGNEGERPRLYFGFLSMSP